MVAVIIWEYTRYRDLMDNFVYFIKYKVFHGQEPPSGESTTTEVRSIINYFQ